MLDASCSRSWIGDLLMQAGWWARRALGNVARYLTRRLALCQGLKRDVGQNRTHVNGGKQGRSVRTACTGRHAAGGLAECRVRLLGRHPGPQGDVGQNRTHVN